ncbi:MAG: UDP-N-acetylmuramate dehydrogenase, partial [Microbacterium sp.]
MTEVDPVPLSRLTTLRTGGAPARMFEATTTEELVATLREVWADGDPWFVLGGGSNLFVGDEPFDGTVVRIRTTGIERMPSPRPGFARLRVQAGHDWDALVAYSVEAGLAGIEAMSGIPGTVGAAPVQNVGAYGQEIVQTLVEVDLVDESTGEVSTVLAADLGLGFRTSALKHHYGSAPARRAVILSVTLELAEVGHEQRPIAGEQLRSALGLGVDDTVSVGWVREHVLATRARKGMVLDDDDPDTYSAGSFFQNAVVSASFARTLPAACPRWPVTPDLDPVLVIPLSAYEGYVPPPAAVESDVKVSAAWLI